VALVFMKAGALKHDWLDEVGEVDVFEVLLKVHSLVLSFPLLDLLKSYRI